MNTLSEQLFPSAACDWQPDRAAWLHDHEETGYLVVEDVVERETLDALRAQVDRDDLESLGSLSFSLCPTPRAKRFSW